MKTFLRRLHKAYLWFALSNIGAVTFAISAMMVFHGPDPAWVKVIAGIMLGFFAINALLNDWIAYMAARKVTHLQAMIEHRDRLWEHMFPTVPVEDYDRAHARRKPCHSPGCIFREGHPDDHMVDGG